MTRAGSIILAPLGVVYGAITETRLALYRRGLLKVARLNAPVISVGNITTGGTGKTPLVEYIARSIQAGNRKICILTRGYGRENPQRRVLVSDGQTIFAGANEAGDEPLLLAEQLRGVAAVISDADRLAAGQWAMKELGAEVFILDDGFQHLRLARDLNLATVDATDAWGGGRLLPQGKLRESRSGLARADCIVITRADEALDLEALKAEIERVSDGRPLFTSHMAARGLRELAAPVPAKEFDAGPDIATPIAAFCALGNPRAFVRQLKNAGYDPASVSEFPDHHRYDQQDVDGLIKKAIAAGARSLITTAKDAVKLSRLSFTLPCYVLDIEVRLDEEPKFLQMIQALMSHKHQLVAGFEALSDKLNKSLSDLDLSRRRGLFELYRGRGPGRW